MIVRKAVSVSDWYLPLVFERPYLVRLPLYDLKVHRLGVEESLSFLI